MAIFSLNSLPKKIKIGWFNSKIDTFFRTWISIIEMQDDPNLSDEERAIIMLKIAFPFTHYARFFFHAEQYMQAVIEFTRCGHEKSKTGAKVIDYEQDWDLICAAFKHDYNIDLERDYLHWWEFCRLLNGLNESNAIVKIIGYRCAELGKIKDKEMRKHYQEMQRNYKIKDKYEKIREKMSDVVFEYQIESKLNKDG